MRKEDTESSKVVIQCDTTRDIIDNFYKYGKRTDLIQKMQEVFADPYVDTIIRKRMEDACYLKNKLV